MSEKTIGEKSLVLHEKWRGKIKISSDVEVSDREALSLAYTPGVATPCLEIEKDLDRSWELTRRQFRLQSNIEISRIDFWKVKENYK